MPVPGNTKQEQKIVEQWLIHVLDDLMHEWWHDTTFAGKFPNKQLVLCNDQWLCTPFFYEFDVDINTTYG